MTYTRGIFVAFLVAASLQLGHCVDSLGRQEATLDETYVFGWSVDGVKNTITVDVKAKTTGWIGFGIAPKTSMVDADIVMGGVMDDGTPYFTDRFSTGFSQPVVDEKQNWTLIAAKEEGEYTFLNFTRALETCDDKDIAITIDTLNVIWAYGATDDTTKKHAKRGGSQFNLLDPESLPFDPASFDAEKIWPVRVNHTLEAVETTYWCTVHKFPKFEKKHHMVALEAFLGDENSVAHTHHFTATSCDLKDPEILAAVQDLYNKPGMDCYGAEYMKIRPKCNAILFGWAVGGKRIVLPDYLGVPVGEEGVGDGSEYIMFEVHYDNPDLVSNITFESGYNLYFSDQLREQEGSVLVVGTNILPSLMIPPKQEEFTLSGHCSSEYTKEFFPEDGLNVVIVNMHSHLAGRELRVRHYRDGKELPWLLSDAHYDFDYQQARLLPQEVKLLPGDHLTMECKMSTKDRSVVTLAGDGSRDEMCHAFLFYYPKIDLLACRSYYPTDALLQEFGILATSPIDPATGVLNVNDPTVISPPELTGQKISKVLNDFNWTEPFVENLQQELRYGRHISTILFSSVSSSKHINEGAARNYTSYPQVPEYVPVSTCGVVDGGDGGDGGQGNGPGGAGAIVSSFVLATLCIFTTTLFL